MRVPIFTRAAKTPWAITEDYLHTILDIARRNTESPEAVAAKLGRQLENTYEVEYRDGVAILNIEGPLFRYANLFTAISGGTSYELLAQDFTSAIENDGVRAVLLNVNSPGGEADGVNELAEMIYNARGTKPIVAYVGGMGASGAYWIASAADRIVADQTALLGSIGVRTALLDDSKAMEDMGLREYVIVSSQSPNKDVDPSDESDRARVQTVVDDLAAVFVAKMARNRGVSEETVLSDFGQGDIMIANKAIESGLADSIGSFEGTLEQLAAPQQEELFPTSGPAAVVGHATEGEGAMYLTSEAPAAGEQQRQNEATAENIARLCPDAAEALRAEGEQRVEQPDTSASVQAERDRIASIIGCEEAQGREGLAQQLALTEGMTLESAQRILTAQPKGAAGKSWVEGMQGDDVDVGADGPGEDVDDPAKVAQATVQSARESGYIR